LESTVGWWNWAVIWMMVVAAIAATGLVVAQYRAIQKASDLSRAQTALSDAKDELVKEKQAETDLKIAEANRKQAEAELALERLRQKESPQWINQKGFLEALKDKPMPALVFVVFAENGESEMFAFQVMGYLSEAGWPVAGPAPLTRNKNAPAYMTAAESLGGSTSGLSVVGRGPLQAPRNKDGVLSSFFRDDTPEDALWRAFQKALNRPYIIHAGADPSLPDNTIRIIVGAKESPVVPSFSQGAEPSRGDTRPLAKVSLFESSDCKIRGDEQAAVHADTLPGGERRLVRAEPQDGFGDFRRLAEAAHWMHGGNAPAEYGISEGAAGRRVARPPGWPHFAN
jgi:hypothetical protein